MNRHGKDNANVNVGDVNSNKPDRGDGEGREGTAQAQLAIQHALVKYAVDPKNNPLPPRPPESLLFEEGEGGTENYRIEGKSIGWAWHLAASGPDDPETRKWHDELLTYLRGERHEFMGAEQLAPDPHFAMFLAAHGVAHFYAAKYGVADILAETAWWFSSLFAVTFAARGVIGAKVVLPCTNCRSDIPNHEVLTTLNAQRFHIGGYRPSLDKLYRDRTLAGYWAMIQPESKVDAIPVGDTIPRMRCPMTVERITGAGYNAYIDQPTQGDVDRRWVCSRVEVRDGRLVGVEKGWSGEVKAVTA